MTKRAELYGVTNIGAIKRVVTTAMVFASALAAYVADRSMG
jgi:hypothetical protein